MKALQTEVKAKEKPILFNEVMIRAILAGKKTQTRRLIKHRDGSLPESREAIFYGTVRQKYRVNDILYIKEPYFFDPDEPGEYMLKYDSGFGWENCPWKSPLYMPKKFARIFLKVTDLRVERLQGITYQDAIKEGICIKNPESNFPCYPDYSDDPNATNQGCITSVGSFQTLWDSINKDESTKWDADPFVWVIEFSVLSASGRENIMEAEKAEI